MRALQITRFGGPEVMDIVDLGSSKRVMGTARMRRGPTGRAGH